MGSKVSYVVSIAPLMGFIYLFQPYLIIIIFSLKREELEVDVPFNIVVGVRSNGEVTSGDRYSHQVVTSL